MAPIVELLPIVPFVVQLTPVTGSGSLTPIWPLAMVAGLGWILAGRPRVGFGFAVVRLVVLYAGLIGLIYTSLSENCDIADPRCIDAAPAPRAVATLLLWVLCAFYVVASLGSAYLLGRTISRSQSSRRKLDQAT
jgi:hypothetical protein